MLEGRQWWWMGKEEGYGSLISDLPYNLTALCQAQILYKYLWNNTTREEDGFSGKGLAGCIVGLSENSTKYALLYILKSQEQQQQPLSIRRK